MSQRGIMSVRHFVGFLVALALVIGALLPQNSAFAQNRFKVEFGKGKSQVYIVRMIDAPVVAYTGGVAGLKATKPAQGQKIDPNSTDVRKYVQYLDNKHNAALSSVGNGRKLYDYHYTFNGFAAELTPEQVATLATTSGVVSVSHDEILQRDTSSTPAFLGLTKPGGLWDQLGGVKGAGEGVVVGIVDSGIWPENRSFSDRDANGKLVFQQIPGWHGRCVPGEEFPATKCNQKLIGAQWFNQGFGGAAGINAAFPYEFVSARDASGHGSHTASTAAGNFGVPAVVDGIDIGTISGMAPRARIATYKVCWGKGTEGGCATSDSVAAIDQAVADGVDVINYSISGSRTSFLDPVEVAFLFAADAGVFVAASAGNSGPTPSTVAHNSPWLTTVAASTHDRVYEATVTLGNGTTYTGASLTGAVGPAPLVYAGDVGAAGANATQVKLCYPGTLDSAKVSGKIVVCDRGVIARTDKSLAVQQAGGVGMILVNTSPNSLNADLHYVPTVHLSHTYRSAVITYAQTPGATASLSQGVGVAGAEAPIMASFSSRGPNLASGDVLKPDMTAPGVDVLAAVSPIGYNGRNYDFLSGTSMSSPHVAGLAALLKDLHPNWTPMMIKSALMTTASQKTNKGNPIAGNPFAYGAGHVTPNAAANPGLVYNASFNNWLGFLCGTGQLQATSCPSIVIDPSNLNQASIAIGELAGIQEVTRRVTNVGTAGTYTVSVAAPSGVSVQVTPSTLTLASGASANYTVKFTTQDTATFGINLFGSLTWSDGAHSVRSPIVVKPVRLAAPTTVAGTGASGSLNYNVTFGFSGPFSASPRGLVAATTFAGNVVDDPANDVNTARSTGVGITVHDVIVPSDTTYARFSLFDDFTDGEDDLDLYVFNSAGIQVGGSGSGTSAEEVNLISPAADTYSVVVHGWQTDGPDANYTLFTWSLGSTAAGNLTVNAPLTAVTGQNGQVTLTWSGLEAAKKYLGSVAYSTGETTIGGTTIVRIDP